jgi:hypothetical protein
MSSFYRGTTPAVLQGGKLIGANFNSTADQAITINSPSGTYTIQNILVRNPSTNMTTAAGGFYTEAGKSGTQIVSSAQVYSALTNATPGTDQNVAQLSVSSSNTREFNLSTIYFSLTTPQGATATADIYVIIRVFL